MKGRVNELRSLSNCAIGTWCRLISACFNCVFSLLARDLARDLLTGPNTLLRPHMFEEMFQHHCCHRRLDIRLNRDRPGV